MTLPRISFIVVVYKMARQAENSMYSLSPAYQRNVTEADCEVIVVENHSEIKTSRNGLTDEMNYQFFLRLFSIPFLIA